MTHYAFAQFRFDSARGILMLGDEEDRLRPQTAQLLQFLLENPERLISKEELIAAIWGDSVVNDQAVFQCINQLRKALGEEAANPRFLKTIPRRGYAWICPAQALEAPADDGPESTDAGTVTADAAPESADEAPVVHVPAPPPGAAVTADDAPTREAATAPRAVRPRRAAWLLVALLTCAAAAYFLAPSGYRAVRGAVGDGTPLVKENKRTRIVFLPFRNDTGDAELQWVELGLMDMVVRSFGNRPRVAPVPTERVLKALKDCGIMRGTEIDPEKSERLREILGAQWVVHVAIARDAKGFQLTYRAVHSNGRSNARVLDGDSLSALATLMTSQLQQTMQLNEIIPERAFSKDPFVNETYGLGVAELSKGYEARAIPYFEVCLDKDPDFLWAGYQLVRCYMYRGDMDTARSRAETYLAAARTHQDTYLEATLLKMEGHIAFQQEQLDTALACYDQGLAIWRNEGYLENVSLSLVDRGMVLTEMDRKEDGQKAFEEALSISDALEDEFSAAGIFHLLGLGYLEGDKVERGLSYLEKAFQIFNRFDSLVDAAYVRLNQGEYFYRHNQPEEAHKYFEEALAAARRAEHKPVGIQTLVLLSEMALEVNQFDASAAYLKEALPWALETGNPLDEVHVRLSQAKLGALSGRKDLLYEAGQRALTLADDLKLEDYRDEALSHFGDYYLIQGNTEAAKVYLDQLWARHLEKPNALALLLRARYQFETGAFRHAYENQLQVKNVFPEIWDSREERLLTRYREAMEQAEAEAP